MEFFAGLAIVDLVFYYTSVVIGITGTLIAVPIVIITFVGFLLKSSFDECKEYKEKGLPYRFLERRNYKKEQKHMEDDRTSKINNAYNFYLSLSSSASQAQNKYYAIQNLLNVARSNNETFENIQKLEKEKQYYFDQYVRLSDDSKKAFEKYLYLNDLKTLSKN